MTPNYIAEIESLRKRLEAAEAVCKAACAGLADVEYSIVNNAWPDRATATLNRLQDAVEAWRASREGSEE